MNDFRPICGACSRNARTVDMPRVVVRVERFTVIRGEGPSLRVVARCHGQVAEAFLIDTPGLDEERLRVLLVNDWED